MMRVESNPFRRAPNIVLFSTKNKTLSSVRERKFLEIVFFLRTGLFNVFRSLAGLPEGPVWLIPKPENRHDHHSVISNFLSHSLLLNFILSCHLHRTDTISEQRNSVYMTTLYSFTAAGMELEDSARKYRRSASSVSWRVRSTSKVANINKGKLYNKDMARFLRFPQQS
jgi:hypothetical protein